MIAAKKKRKQYPLQLVSIVLDLRTAQALYDLLNKGSTDPRNLKRIRNIRSDLGVKLNWAWDTYREMRGKKS